MEEIAVRADVGVGTLYRRFPTRRTFSTPWWRRPRSANGRSPRRSSPRWPRGRGLRVRAALHRGAQLLAGHHLRASVADERDGPRPDGPASPVILERSQRAGSVRPDIEVADIVVVLMAVRSIADVATRSPSSLHCVSRVRVGRTSSRPPGHLPPPLTVSQLDRVLGGAEGLAGWAGGRRRPTVIGGDRPGRKGATTCGQHLSSPVFEQAGGSRGPGRLIRAFTPMSHCCNVHLIAYCVTTVQDASCGA